MFKSVTLLTKPDVFRFSSICEHPVLYTRILGATTKGDQVVITPETPKDNMSLELPVEFVRRLFTALKLIKAGEQMNCHRFSRILTDTLAPRFVNDDVSYAVSDVHEENEISRLELGKLGLIGSASDINGARHSLIGLGLSDPTAIQVMSAQGEVGIARYEDVLKLYRGSGITKRSADLFRAEF